MATKNLISISLSAVIYPEGQAWIAHCLELDIVAQGSSDEEAFLNLDDLVQFQIETAMQEGDICSIFRQAPPSICHIFSLAKSARRAQMALKTRKRPSFISRFEARAFARQPA